MNNNEYYQHVINMTSTKSRIENVRIPIDYKKIKSVFLYASDSRLLNSFVGLKIDRKEILKPTFNSELILFTGEIALKDVELQLDIENNNQLFEFVFSKATNFTQGAVSIYFIVQK